MRRFSGAHGKKNYQQRPLDYTNWNRKKAAGLLDISYKSLLNKIKKYKLTINGYN